MAALAFLGGGEGGWFLFVPDCATTSYLSSLVSKINSDSGNSIPFLMVRESDTEEHGLVF